MGNPDNFSLFTARKGRRDPGNTVMRTRSKNNAMRILYGYV